MSNNYRKNDRINLSGTPDGYSKILTIKDTNFWENIESGIRPLVKVFVDNGITTYSSCHGHFDGNKNEIPFLRFYCSPYISSKIEKFVKSLNSSVKFEKVYGRSFNGYGLTYYIIFDTDDHSRENYDFLIKDFCEKLEKCKSEVLLDNRVEHWSILVKPTNSCNLDCKYCYEKPMRDKLGNCKLSYSDINHILELATNYSKSITWIWHGGEPTLMGVKWYKDVQELFYKYSEYSNINQSMQTNGTRLNKEWAELSVEYGIQIGVSYDGSSQDIRLGDSTLNVKDNIKEFTNNGGELGGICVVNKQNCNKQIEIYRHYHKDLGIGLSLNHIFHSEECEKNDLEPDFKYFSDEYKKFLEFYIHDVEKYNSSERTADTFIDLVFGSLRGICSHSDCRYGWMGINSDGSLYPCDRYLPERYSMGNIRDFKDIDSVYKTTNYKLYDLEIEKRKYNHCNDCGFYTYCSGGCNATHISKFGNGSGVDEFSCEIFRREFLITYDCIRAVDIYNEEYNTRVMNNILSNGYLTLKEILEFLERKGINHSFEYDCSSPKNLINCSEFKLFRIFNGYKNTGTSCHYDGIKLSNVSKSSVSSCKNLRESKLEKLFSHNYLDILNLIREDDYGC